MKYRVTGPDGKAYDVTTPEGASQDQAIDYVKRTYYGGGSQQQPAEQMTALERLGTGMLDPVVGGLQLLDHVVPLATWGEAGANWLSDQVGIDHVFGPGDFDDLVKRREARIKASTPKGFDWYRLAGNVLSPVNLALPEIGEGYVIGRAALTGAEMSILQPTEAPNYWFDKAKQAVEGGVFGAGLGVVGKAASPAVRQLMALMTRDHTDTVVTDAAKKILEQINNDTEGGAPTAEQMIDLVNEARAEGQPFALSDINEAGNVRSLLGHIYRQGGPAKALIGKFFKDRDEKAYGRLRALIAKDIRGGPSAHTTIEGLIRSRSAAAKPLWDQVNALQNIWSPRLQQFLDDPVIKAGLATGYKLERLESLAEKRPFDPTQMGIDVDVDGNIKIVRKPNMRVLQMAKQGLDAMIESEKDKITGRLTKMGVALTKTKNAYVNELKALDRSGTYEKALKLWESDSSAIDAVKWGQNVFKLASEDEVAEEFNRLSPANKEFAKLGLANQLRQRIGSVGLKSDDAKALINSQDVKEYLRPFFKTDPERQKFIDSVLRETDMFTQARSVVGGSQTAQRQVEDAGFQTIGHIIDATHSPTALARLAARLYKEGRLRPNKKANLEIAKMILGGPIGPDSPMAKAAAGTIGKTIPERVGEAVKRTITSRPVTRAAGYVAGARHPLHGTNAPLTLHHPLGQPGVNAGKPPVPGAVWMNQGGYRGWYVQEPDGQLRRIDLQGENLVPPPAPQNPVAILGTRG